MCFAVQVCEKIKHGTRGDVTVFAPVVSCVIVFKRLWGRGWRRSLDSDSWLVRGRPRRHRWGLLRNKDGVESTWRLEVERIHSDQNVPSLKLKMEKFLTFTELQHPRCKWCVFSENPAFALIPTETSDLKFQLHQSRNEETNWRLCRSYLNSRSSSAEELYNVPINSVIIPEAGTPTRPPGTRDGHEY